jgi:Cu+-exporting ATPase
MARVTHLVFDKTGTLTTATPRVARFEVFPDSGLDVADVMRLTAAVEADVPHPAAHAMLAHARSPGIEPAPAQTVSLVPGRGVTGEVAGRRVAVGSAALLEQRGCLVGDPDGRWLWIEVGGVVVGRVQLTDSIDPAAAGVIGWLRARGFRLTVLTGAARADDVVPWLVAAHEVQCGLTPDEKASLVRRLAAVDRVAMIGDGLNDAPALATADVGIAVAHATDLARLAADVVLLGNGVAALPGLVTLARRTVAVARQNLGWAFGYNAIALSLAAAGRLTPVVAALAMLASSAAVLANARRLRPRPSASRSAGAGSDEALTVPRPAAA